MDSLIVPDFDLALTIRSGQMFCYEALGEQEFVVVDTGRAFWVKQEGERLYFDGISKRKLVRYFDLDYRLDRFFKRLKKHHALRPLLERYRGLRLVRQEPRQAILTFILSSNNNQKRIKRMVDALRGRHGQELVIRGTSAKTFPTRKSFACDDDLAGLALGYRCVFIVGADRRLTRGFLKKLNKLDYESQKQILQTLPGVGPKVADCAIAYSTLRDGSAFPADVWVRRALAAWFADEFRGKPFTDKNIAGFAQRAFGGDATYAQQYLFLAAQELLRDHEVNSKSTHTR